MMDSDRFSFINWSATKQQYLKNSIYSSLNSSFNTQIGINASAVDIPHLIHLNPSTSEQIISSNNQKQGFNFQQIGVIYTYIRN